MLFWLIDFLSLSICGAEQSLLGSKGLSVPHLIYEETTGPSMGFLLLQYFPLFIYKFCIDIDFICPNLLTR